MQLAEAARQISEAGRWLDARGWAPATSGNYSIRLDARRVAVTVSGRHKGRLVSDDVMLIDGDGRSTDERRPSAETPLHLAIYRQHATAGAILHVHSVHSTVLSMAVAGESSLKLAGYELLKAFPEIHSHETTLVVPIFDNTQDIESLARALPARLSDGPCFGFLIRGHGLYCWGRTMEDALRAVEAFEFLFACELDEKDSLVTRLRVYDDRSAAVAEIDTVDGAEIARRLADVGVRFERWRADCALDRDADQDAVLAAYRADVDRLMRENGYRAVDVVRMAPDHPDKEALRQKFLDEHTHAEDEVRFFVEGSGLFCLHIDGKVFAVLCERGDLIGVPTGVAHWFDMSDQPYFAAIRLFTHPEGWVAQFTGSDISSRFGRAGE